LSDLLSLPQIIKDFGNSLNPAVGKCLEGNAEFTSLSDKYNLTGADSSVIEKKVITYVTLHYLSVHKALGEIDSDWHSAKYYQAGWKGGEEGHQILGIGYDIPTLTDREIIQQGLNGLFEQNNLKDPVTIVKCIDDPSAHKIVVFAGELLDKAAKGSLSDLISLIPLVNDFWGSLDPAISDCLDGDAELISLTDAYGVTNVDASIVQLKVITYATLHYLAVHKWLGEVDNDWHAGKYYQVGWKGGEEGHLILGSSSINLHRIKKFAANLRHMIDEQFVNIMTM